MKLDDYQSRFESWAKLDRDEAGVLRVTLHTDGSTLEWHLSPAHWEIAELFHCITLDEGTRAVLITHNGDTFINFPQMTRDEANAKAKHSAASWDATSRVAVDMIKNELDIPVPMVAALNGPAPYHAEIALLCDAVIAPPHAFFADKAHYPLGSVPGDGVALVWNALLGPNRSRYFLMTGQEIHAEDALALGIISEIQEPDRVLTRAYELAHNFATQTPSVQRYTRFVLTQPLRRAVAENLTYTLALQGMGTWARPANTVD